MQDSLVVLNCLEKSSLNNVLQRVYRQLFNLNFYGTKGQEIVAALKKENYSQLSTVQLNELRAVLQKILSAIFAAEFAETSILKELKGQCLPASLVEKPEEILTKRIADGRWWQLYDYFRPWRMYLPQEKLLIWDENFYRWLPDGGTIPKIDLGGFTWQLGKITLQSSFRTTLLRPYLRYGKPLHRSDLLNLPEKVIIATYKAEESRFRQILSVLTEPRKEAEMLYLLRQSLLKTLASKYRTSTRDIEERFELF